MANKTPHTRGSETNDYSVIRFRVTPNIKQRFDRLHQTEQFSSYQKQELAAYLIGEGIKQAERKLDILNLLDDRPELIDVFRRAADRDQKNRSGRTGERDGDEQGQKTPE